MKQKRKKRFITEDDFLLKNKVKMYRCAWEELFNFINWMAIMHPKQYIKMLKEYDNKFNELLKK